MEQDVARKTNAETPDTPKLLWPFFLGGYYFYLLQLMSVWQPAVVYDDAGTPGLVR